NFDDSSWEKVNLPHDWAIKGPFNEQENGSTGKLPWRGEGWYRNTFTLSSEDQGKVVYIKFDGVMSSPQIFVNGKLAGKWDYGYSSFYLDISDFVKYGQENGIAVYVDNRKHDSRWYPGAGIYRKVEMMTTEKVHEEIWGTYITTPVVSQSYAEMRILSNVWNKDSEDKKVTVEAVLVSPEGFEIKTVASRQRTLPAGSLFQFDNWMTVVRPQIWDVDHPVLYSIKTKVIVDGKVVDSNETPFGFRSFEFTADDGFHLNGRRLQLRGVNLHHDHGPLGAAFNKRSMERKLEILKEMGCNAVRTSHNICAPELIELCDKMGLLVFNEAFDKYDKKADIFEATDFYEFGERVIKNFVLRDRNNPSVFIWSVGNEMGDIQSNSNFGLQRLAAMVGLVRKYDITRPVTMACDQESNAHWRHFDYYDVHAWNYDQRWKTARKLDPSKSVIISESASTVSTRGFYELPLPEKPTDFTQSNQVSSYDLHAPSWAEVCDDDFMWQENDKYIAGEFVWTGFDYLGEPTPYSSSRSSYFGIVDLCGIPKDRYYLYQSYWRPEKDLIHILPHWNWPGHEGKKVPVFVYTNGDEAELFLNGKSLGKQSKKPKSEISTERYRLMWHDVVYEAGELKAVAYRAGKVIGEKVLRTAGEAYTLKLTPDRSRLKASGEDLSFILVEACDKNGNLCPLADYMINFELKGPGEIAGVGNGNPQSHEPFVAPYRKLFNGKAMLIVRTTANKPGKITVEASAEGLKPAKTSLTSEQ
ncbi:MAG: glycoside hydrolase family 2 TIM barrel-domain containing protein, partial [Bacteroidota bacterium]|nr:glycoside hydrolase family 2 TIM barrel-domain containing protein [Bacteroidota bacterium]